MSQLNLNSIRAKKARLAKRIGSLGFQLIVIIGVLAVVCAIALFWIRSEHAAYFLVALALLSILVSLWYRRDLVALPVADSDEWTDHLAGSVLGCLDPAQSLTPESLWDSLSSHWQVIFITNHLLIPPQIISQILTTDGIALSTVWQRAEQIAHTTDCQIIEPGHIGAALLLVSPKIKDLLSKRKLQQSDVEAVAQWLGRGLKEMQAPAPYFGGIGRDWANGFTPLLNRFGHNVSLNIERGGGSFTWLTGSPGVASMKNAFSRGASALAVIGQDGVGKTSHVYALAQLLLEEQHDRHLEHRQVIELNPSVLLSSANRAGALENIIMRLVNEIAHAGHIILFLDDAQLFFNSGVGSFDVTQILLPVIQAQAIQIILAMDPHSYQQLRATHSAFANLLTPIMLNELGEKDTMCVLEDAVIGLEQQHHVLVAYEAVREAYRLSGRYEQDLAYPGKALQLLTQAIPHANNQVIDAEVVQITIEQTKGVKIGNVAEEADMLLNLEDKIHERMINQTHAVSVVANALRRARAGVANPKRPFGSFLFLGPTGVGKTELAKAIAATYFGAESHMIRLDMSEYQQPKDVSRLLSDGRDETRSLILEIRQQPFSVVLLDEIEKSHPNVLNLLLQLLDEGQLTDSAGRTVSFKDCIIIATSNAGAQAIREHVEKGESPESFQPQLLEDLMKSGPFKPELLNRFDEIVVFRPLNQDELMQVAQLMINEVNTTLAAQNISVRLTPAAVGKIVAEGYDPRLGARPMRRALQRAVEDAVAKKILQGVAKPGDQIVLDVSDLAI